MAQGHCMVTCKSNANAHPGQLVLDMMQKWHSVDKKVAGVCCIAKLEYNVKKKFWAQDSEASAPKDKLMIPHTRRVWPGGQHNIDSMEEVPNSEDKRPREHTAKFMEEIPDSGNETEVHSDFVHKSSNASESSDEMDVDEDESNCSIKCSMKTGRKKKGVTMWEQITAACDLIVNTDQLKPSKKKLKPSQPSGVTHNWENNAPYHPIPTQNHSRSEASSCLANHPLHLENNNNVQNCQDSTIFQYGGIPSDEEDIQQEALQERTNTGFDISIAKVEDTHIVPLNSMETSTQSQRNACRDQCSLPYNTCVIFADIVDPKICNDIGTCNPWDMLTNANIVCHWNNFFGDLHPIYVSDYDLGLLELFKVVKQVMNTCISNWIYKFVEGAMKGIQADWECHGFTMDAQQAVHILALLGTNPDNNTKKDQPFLWRSSDELEPTTNPATGLFMACLVAHALAEHITTISSLHKSCQLKKQPSGILIMFRDYLSIGTGANDANEYVCCVIIYKNKIKKLDNKCWATINQAALKAKGKDKVTVKSDKPATVLEPDNDNDDDSDLFDPEFDIPSPALA
ncbi:hypothetical protein BDQ12DRAFT_728169 [Crucibulum laeve]|uniref:Uncharacterized protein n=1 Tax=Crucibulum laeve TaxID=68775 RepID=A0A5C3LM08_9AGAR|nr:hypothetical protein BDQ12DRAFT_728169 [Crucibulum laeve]